MMPGFAEGAVVAYVISLAKKASNAGALAARLQGEAGLPASSATQTFASELLARVPRRWRSRQHLSAAGKGSHQRRQEEQVSEAGVGSASYPDASRHEGLHVGPMTHAVTSHRTLCRQYALLEMSDEEADTAEPPPAPTTSALPKKKEKQIRRKPEAAAVEAERDDAEEPLQLGRRRKRDWEEDEGAFKPCMHHAAVCRGRSLVKAEHPEQDMGVQ